MSVVAQLVFSCVLVSVITKAHSLKCYQCLADSLEECDKNSTVVDCNPGTPCGTQNVTFAIQNIPIKITYIKNCFPFANCTRYYNQSTGLQVKSCIFTRCSKDYCNGVTPTTAVPVTMTKATGTGDVHSAKNPSSTSSKLHWEMPIVVTIMNGLVSWRIV